MISGLKPALADGKQIVLPYDSRYPLVVNNPALGADLFCYPPIRVAPSMFNDSVLNSGT